MLESCTRYRGGRARTGIVSPAAALGASGTWWRVPAGLCHPGEGAQNKRGLLRKGLKLLRRCSFSSFPGVCCSKAALPAPSPERTPAVRCRPWARGGQMCGIGSRPLRSRRLPSSPEPFHTAVVPLVCSHERCSPLSSALENRREMLPLKSLKWGLMDAAVGSRSSWNDTGEGGCVALSVGTVAQRSWGQMAV